MAAPNLGTDDVTMHRFPVEIAAHRPKGAGEFPQQDPTTRGAC